ncbi:hypothetical protein AP75_10420 [Kaistella haifensis DSM 19056]|uniref:SnoaL-like domain-containing protein n=1 Tax=Kaistella haifensis DSM 19056 TaxID=1450526 RepID=A0A246B8C0_9FLAO|nr:hypothetical protein [Kaistella haifensis]OWK97629.1 hypothetical protein AP75_10420 [Kaistella haifensis DSM 19056]
MAIEQFVKNYIDAWSTTNTDERRQLIEEVYSTSAKFYANEPGDEAVEHHGLEKIYGNITQVNERLVVGNRLITELTSYSENNDTLRVTWQMKTPDGNIALKGMNFLQLDNSKKIKRDYIFIN